MASCSPGPGQLSGCEGCRVRLPALLCVLSTLGPLGAWSQGLARVFPQVFPQASPRPQGGTGHGARGGRPSLGPGSSVCEACLCGHVGLLAGEQ